MSIVETSARAYHGAYVLQLGGNRTTGAGAGAGFAAPPPTLMFLLVARLVGRSLLVPLSFLELSSSFK